MKSSKAQIQAKYHKIPMICFEDQKLTSFSGLLVFQVLFRRLNLKKRLYQCFSNGKVSPIFGRHLVVLLLIVRNSRSVHYKAFTRHIWKQNVISSQYIVENRNDLLIW